MIASVTLFRTRHAVSLLMVGGSFSPFRFYPPLRPLRSLREVCLRAVMIFLHADYAESAEFFIFLGVLRWRWRGRKLRYDERAQRGGAVRFPF